VIVPLLAEVNFTPSSTPGPAPASTTVGVALLLQIMHGHVGGGACAVSSVLPDTPFCVAETVVVPSPIMVARPLLLRAATDVFEDVHAARDVISCVLPPR